MTTEAATRGQYRLVVEVRRAWMTGLPEAEGGAKH